MKDDYNTNSHYTTYTFYLQKVRRMYFLSSGVKGLILYTALSTQVFCVKSPQDGIFWAVKLIDLRNKDRPIQEVSHAAIQHASCFFLSVIQFLMPTFHMLT